MKHTFVAIFSRPTGLAVFHYMNFVILSVCNVYCTRDPKHFDCRISRHKKNIPRQNTSDAEATPIVR